jgi:hypothetical protein
MTINMKKRMIPEVDMTEVNACLTLTQKIRSDASKSKKWGWELPLSDFAKAMLCLNPQSYGGRVDKRLSENLGLESTDDKDRGDRKSINGTYVEWKGSFFTSSNTTLNLVQIRPWQDTDYIYYAFDMRDLSNIKMQLFYLNKIQMQSELAGATSAHGTKNSNIDNSNNELAVRIEADSDIYNRWIAEYGVSLEELRARLEVEDDFLDLVK